MNPDQKKAANRGPQDDAEQGKPSSSRSTIAEQARERQMSQSAHNAEASNRERMVDIGRGNQQAGRH